MNLARKEIGMNHQGPGKIDWTDWTWNPISGCWGPNGTAERPQRCYYCYAAGMANRFKQSFAPAFHPERLEAPLKLKKAAKIFVCSTADLFGDWVPRKWIEAVLEIAYESPQHTFQFLTKNPMRLQEFNPWPPNAWVGTTITNGDELEARVFHLSFAAAPIRFLSWEPVLGPLSAGNQPWLMGKIDWLIIGAMTGRHAAKHPCRQEWVEDIERAADRVKMPVWEKDSLASIMRRPLRKEWPK